MVRKKIVAGNWKMNGSHGFTKNLLEQLVQAPELNSSIEVIVFPSFTYLGVAAECLKNTTVQLGAQNVSQYDDGAFTGEVSAQMLADVGCGYVLVGHSERRTLFGETNQIVAEKAHKALQHNLKPVICVGETLQDRQSNKTEEIILQQLDAVLEKNTIASLSTCVIAYEPVWAIGTGETATPDQAEAVHGLIRTHLANKDNSFAEQVPILYGGSVKPGNAEPLFLMPNIDGGLIGGASLVSDDFIQICQAIG